MAYIIAMTAVAGCVGATYLGGRKHGEQTFTE
jgi:hypothetical protein